MHLAPCIGLALIAIGKMRITHATIVDGDEENKLPAHQEKTRLLQRAKKTLLHALSLQGLEAETKSEGQLALAQTAFLLGEIDTAQHLTLLIMEEAHRSKQLWLLAGAQRLIGSLLSVQGDQQQAIPYFRQALQAFQQCGMRLEWARTLCSYGEALLQSSHSGNTDYQQGLRYLQDGQQALRECHALLDLQMVDRLLSTQRRE